MKPRWGSEGEDRITPVWKEPKRFYWRGAIDRRPFRDPRVSVIPQDPEDYPQSECRNSVQRLGEAFGREEGSAIALENTCCRCLSALRANKSFEKEPVLRSVCWVNYNCWFVLKITARVSNGEGLMLILLRYSLLQSSLIQLKSFVVCVFVCFYTKA